MLVLLLLRSLPFDGESCAAGYRGCVQPGERALRVCIALCDERALPFFTHKAKKGRISVDILAFGRWHVAAVLCA